MPGLIIVGVSLVGGSSTMMLAFMKAQTSVKADTFTQASTIHSHMVAELTWYRLPVLVKVCSPSLIHHSHNARNFTLNVLFTPLTHIRRSGLKDALSIFETIKGFYVRLYNVENTVYYFQFACEEAKLLWDDYLSIKTSVVLLPGNSRLDQSVLCTLAALGINLWRQTMRAVKDVWRLLYLYLLAQIQMIWWACECLAFSTQSKI